MNHRLRFAARAPRQRSRSARALAATLVLGGAMAAGVGPASGQAGCSEVEVVVARETGAGQGSSWVLNGVANTISRQRPGQTSRYDVVYPASADFVTSTPKGVTDLVNHLNAEASSCPDQRYVLLGYSQGAMVIGDALTTGWGRSFGGDGTLSQSASDRISAIVFFGDPRFRSGESFNAGSPAAGANGVYPRAAGALGQYSDRIRSYCTNGDLICQGGFNFFAHMSYVFDLATQTQAAQFVTTKL